MKQKKYWLAKGMKIFAFMAFAGTLVTYVVMSLWNWLMPVIFGLTMITFWQALGLLVLSKILFGWSWGRGPRGKWGKHREGRWKHRMKAHWDQMTPEEQEAFKTKMKHRCRTFNEKEVVEAPSQAAEG